MSSNRIDSKENKDLYLNDLSRSNDQIDNRNTSRNTIKTSSGSSILTSSDGHSPVIENSPGYTGYNPIIRRKKFKEHTPRPQNIKQNIKEEVSSSPSSTNEDLPLVTRSGEILRDRDRNSKTLRRKNRQHSLRMSSEERTGKNKHSDTRLLSLNKKFDKLNDKYKALITKKQWMFQYDYQARERLQKEFETQFFQLFVTELQYAGSDLTLSKMKEQYNQLTTGLAYVRQAFKKLFKHLHNEQVVKECCGIHLRKLNDRFTLLNYQYSELRKKQWVSENLNKWEKDFSCFEEHQKELNHIIANFEAISADELEKAALELTDKIDLAQKRYNTFYNEYKANIKSGESSSSVYNLSGWTTGSVSSLSAEEKSVGTEKQEKSKEEREKTPLQITKEHHEQYQDNDIPVFDPTSTLSDDDEVAVSSNNIALREEQNMPVPSFAKHPNTFFISTPTKSDKLPSLDSDLTINKLEPSESTNEELPSTRPAQN